MFADSKQFFATIEQIAEEKGISRDIILDTIGMAVAAAYKREYGKRGQIIRAEFDPGTKTFQMYQIRIVVDESMLKSEEEGRKEAEKSEEREDFSAPSSARGEQSEREPGAEVRENRNGFLGDEGVERPRTAGEQIRFNPERHIMIQEARQIQSDIQIGAELKTALPAQESFGRIAAQTAKQVIVQRIREAERDTIYQDFKAREGEIVSGVVQRIEGPNVFVDLGRLTALLPPEEQIPGERFRIGGRVRAVLLALMQAPRGLEARLSRAHPRFVELLFSVEVPEIGQGNVEIKAVAREPGLRTKIAVVSHAEGIDPVGACVGQRGTRVLTVINELGGEKIDIIEWSEDPAVFIAKALSPAKTADVELDQERLRADVAVPEDQVSLAIGRRGQNVRLAAKLTGWRIDIRGAAGEVMGSSAEIGEQPISAGEPSEVDAQPIPADDEANASETETTEKS